ncbi:transporter substrate-binding domain-containing protein [Terasakiella sp. A23]|uniref:substrate-binding periplasmic protein n=1 Tax=Terasakiella sp. FCG-A23 TaxID=3080561 RepID=UPI002955DB64|nr:transporter substrate-binding domain-containing protein [Terasakiella sp. A23]MDV7340397.1 transporter substrate-binding domain-containing protein [Terasakiella sp. A23]
MPYIKNLLEKEPDGSWKGPLLNIFHKIEQQTGSKLIFSVLPFPRAVALTRDGKVDLGVFLESKKRNSYAIPITPISTSYFVIASLPKQEIKSAKDLANKKVGVSSKGVSSEIIARHPHGPVLKFKSHRDLMTALLAGKVDAILTPDFRFVEMVENRNLSFSQFAKPIKLSPQKLMLYASHRFALNTKDLVVFSQLTKLRLKGFGSDYLFAQY